jgi:hypothetical protein
MSIGKNRTRIGPHLAQPWAAERPVISVLEIGYVRRSEFTFTPKHGSWLNFVEGFFSKLARSVLRHIRVATGLRWREGKGPQRCQVAKCD